MTTLQPNIEVSQVPLLGWSASSEHLRRFMQQHASDRNSSVLIFGEQGTGKTETANIWRQVTQSQLPVVDLDTHVGSIVHPCIATSKRMLPVNAQFYDLARECWTDTPSWDSDGPLLSQDELSPFVLRLCLLPIRKRPADILAFLHYYNQCVLPTKSGCSYQAITTHLLSHLLFSSTWYGNFGDLAKFLLAAAKRDLRLHRPSTAPATLGLIERNSDLPYFDPRAPIVEQWTHFGRNRLDPMLRNSPPFDRQSIPFAELPRLAIHVFRWQCLDQLGQKWVESIDDNGFVSVSDKFPIDVTDIDWDEPPTVDEFLRLSETDFLHELLNDHPYLTDDEFSFAQQFFPNFCSAFEMNFGSLQQGLGVAPTLFRYVIAHNVTDVCFEPPKPNPRKRGRPRKYPEVCDQALEWREKEDIKGQALFRRCTDKYPGAKIPENRESFMRSVRRARKYQQSTRT